MRRIGFSSAVLVLLGVAFVVAFHSWVSHGKTEDNREIVVAASAPISTLDSLTRQSHDSAAEWLRPLVFNSLTRRSAKDLSIEGDLAKEILTSADRKSISFVLRRGVKFHDGRPLTAVDVKYTLETLFATKGYKAFAFQETERKQSSSRQVHLISAITVSGPDKVTLRIARPSVRELVLSNLAAIPIIPSGSAVAGRDLNVGTGPFRLVKLDANKSEILLEANPFYWEGEPSIASLRFKTILNFEQLYTGFRSGSVNLFRLESWIQPIEREKLRLLDAVHKQAFNGNNIQYLGLNVSVPPLSDLQIRKAIAHAIDREKLIREKLDGNGRPAYSILPETSWAYTSGKKYEYNLAIARSLVRSSRHRHRPLVIQTSSSNTQILSAVTSIRDSLRDAGLNVQLDIIDPNTLRNNLMLGNFHMSVGMWIGGNQEPIFLRDLFHSTRIASEGIACCNRSRYRNAKVDRLLDRVVDDSSLESMAINYKQAWNIISNDVPVIPLWYPADVIVHDRRIQIGSNPNGEFKFLKTATFKQ
jgi:peptide/nickel transport system substrate-binding protein